MEINRASHVRLAQRIIPATLSLDAEDLVQDTYVQLWVNHSGTWPWASSFVAQAMRWNLIKHIRRGKETLQLLEFIPSPARMDEQVIAGIELERMLTESVRRMGTRVLLLSMVGYTSDELAEARGTTPGSIKSQRYQEMSIQRSIIDGTYTGGARRTSRLLRGK